MTSVEAIGRKTRKPPRRLSPATTKKLSERPRRETDLESLTASESTVLEILTNQEDHTVSFPEVHQALYGEEEDDHLSTINSILRILRDKLGNPESILSTNEGTRSTFIFAPESLSKARELLEKNKDQTEGKITSTELIEKARLPRHNDIAYNMLDRAARSLCIKPLSVGGMTYYTEEEMSRIIKKLGRENIDRELGKPAIIFLKVKGQDESEEARPDQIEEISKEAGFDFARIILANFTRRQTIGRDDTFLDKNPFTAFSSCLPSYVDFHETIKRNHRANIEMLMVKALANTLELYWEGPVPKVFYSPREIGVFVACKNLRAADKAPKDIIKEICSYYNIPTPLKYTTEAEEIIATLAII
ncbi:MAG: helix-turn-helix domain-containing protein [Patescibacteria group bacterium]|nr:helix-turn-helix domain-containing protein [Patescibacteria group bacterium]